MSDKQFPEELVPNEELVYYNVKIPTPQYHALVKIVLKKARESSKLVTVTDIIRLAVSDYLARAAAEGEVPNDA